MNEKTKTVLLVVAGVIILAVAVVSGLFQGDEKNSLLLF